MISLRKMKPFLITTCILAGLWLAACSHTGTPNVPKPQTPETQETKEAGQPSSSQPADSSQQESREKSKTSQKDAPDASEPQEKVADEQPQKSQTASRETTEPDAGETTEKSSAGRSASPQTAEAKLEEAREKLRISQATEKRIASELEELKKSGNASAEDIRNYEVYLDRVQDMVAENQKIVEKMEAAYTRHSPQKDLSNETASGELETLLEQKIPEEQTQDEVAALDRQLNASLSDFDAMLLKEMEEIRSESSSKMQDLAQEAAEAAKRLRKKGFEGDATGTEDSEKDSEQASKDAATQEGEPEEGEAGTKTASSDSSGKGGEGPSRKDQRRVDYEDDDIVARQLREAAENETDPELKEKLWKEYEEYKKSQQ
jgi:hypothetical protein